MAWANGGAVDKLVAVAFFTRRLTAVLIPSLLAASCTLALMVTRVVPKGSGSRVIWPCTSANVASSASSMSLSMVEAKERPSALVVKLKMYVRIVNKGLPEAVEEVRATSSVGEGIGCEHGAGEEGWKLRREHRGDC